MNARQIRELAFAVIAVVILAGFAVPARGWRRIANSKALAAMNERMNQQLGGDTATESFNNVLAYGKRHPMVLPGVMLPGMTSPVAKLDGPDALPLLLDKLDKGTDDEQAVAAWCLGFLADPRAKQALLGKLTSFVLEMKQEAKRIKEGKAADIKVIKLETEQVLAALGRLKAKEAFQPLKELVDQSVQAEVKRLAVMTLAVLDAPGVADVLIAHLDDVPVASEYLGLTGDPRAVAILKERVTKMKPDWYGAVWGLIWLRTDEAIEAITELTDHENPRVRSSSIGALRWVRQSRLLYAGRIVKARELPQNLAKEVREKHKADPDKDVRSQASWLYSDRLHPITPWEGGAREGDDSEKTSKEEEAKPSGG